MLAIHSHRSRAFSHFISALSMITIALTADTAGAESPFVFRDATTEAGLLPAAASINGHGAGWGDIDGDGFPDLYISTFHYENTKPNLLFRNVKGKFVADPQESITVSMRGTGVVFADLDNDGDLDLYLGAMPIPKENKQAEKVGHPFAPCQMFRNEGGGKFTNISEGNGACPTAFGGRSAALLDYDGDGLIDLLVGEDPFPGYNGSKTTSTRLFRNKGGLAFEDVSVAAGLPEIMPGLGVAVADVNNDSWPDFYAASNASGLRTKTTENTSGNRLFLNDTKGKFREVTSLTPLFSWADQTKKGGDNMVCGICFGDVNRDGLLDAFVGQHYSNPWTEPIANRLYLNRGIKNGEPVFEQVTEAVGLKPLPLKAPHVEIQDFDNDGWPDLYMSIVKFRDGKPYPLIYKNLGVKDGLPRFEEAATSVNDFPNADDLALKGSGPFFKKMVEDKKVVYTAPGPTADFDNDGRLDMFLPNWWAELPSLLLHNQTPGGNWIRITVEGSDGVNRMGIGSKVRIYPAGKLGDNTALLGCQDISVGYGYASGQTAMCHFGLGKVDTVDVEVTLPSARGKIVRKGLKAGTAHRLSSP